MIRYKMIIEYEGTEFSGWQKQKNALSVQQSVEDALFKLVQCPVKLYGAGRTDAGVHALGQVAHFELNRPYEPYVILHALNFFIQPRRIAILHVEEVDAHFHARFSAKCRHYTYYIIQRRAPLALSKNQAWHITEALDEKAMEQASCYLIGTHDFTSFRASNCQSASPIKTLHTIDFHKEGDKITIALSAPSFLHHQVRIIIGSLVLVGKHKKPVPWITEALLACKREAAGPTAPAYGLFFMHVDY